MTNKDSKCVVDLFASAGGFGLGFSMDGYNIPLAIEMDECACETYRYNHPDTRVYCGDITKISDIGGLLPSDIIVDGVIGGPPCQGFSLSGNRDPRDPRNSLFMDFVRFTSFYKPRFFVMENVLGLLSMCTVDNILVRDIILDEFHKLGYNVTVKVLNSRDYGVPQSRKRVFFIGVRDDYFFDEGMLTPDTVDGVWGVWDAISDLPYIEAREGEEFMEYTMPPVNMYQEYCRQNNSSGGVCNHVSMRHTRRIVERFQQIGWGESVKDVPSQYGQRKRGSPGVCSGKVYGQNNYRPFPDKPCPTLTASFQSNFVHPFCNCNFTAREGARLQSFPDYYVFKGKRTTMSWEKGLSQYQQVGNSVPPLLAKCIGECINEYFSGED